MKSDETRLFIKRYVDLWQREDIHGLVECYAENAHVDSPMFHALDGREAVAKSFSDFFQGFADSTIRVDDIIIDNEAGNKCVILWTSHAKHRGMLFGMPGTGRRVEVSGAFVMRFENGLIVAERRLYDFVGMLLQLGVLKAKAV
jgi:steroid delta-isomerase-like uncharacterized protein